MRRLLCLEKSRTPHRFSVSVYPASSFDASIVLWTGAHTIGG
jgi:hypothetical protein